MRRPPGYCGDCRLRMRRRALFLAVTPSDRARSPLGGLSHPDLRARPSPAQRRRRCATNVTDNTSSTPQRPPEHSYPSAACHLPDGRVHLLSAGDVPTRRGDSRMLMQSERRATLGCGRSPAIRGRSPARSGWFRPTGGTGVGSFCCATRSVSSFSTGAQLLRSDFTPISLFPTLRIGGGLRRRSPVCSTTASGISSTVTNPSSGTSSASGRGRAAVSTSTATGCTSTSGRDRVPSCCGWPCRTSMATTASSERCEGATAWTRRSVGPSSQRRGSATRRRSIGGSSPSR